MKTKEKQLAVELLAIAKAPGKRIVVKDGKPARELLEIARGKRR